MAAGLSKAKTFYMGEWTPANDPGQIKGLKRTSSSDNRKHNTVDCDHFVTGLQMCHRVTSMRNPEIVPAW